MEKNTKPRKRFLIRSRVVVVVDSVCEAENHADAKARAVSRAEDIGCRMAVADALREIESWCEPPPSHERLTAGGYEDGAVLGELAHPWLRVDLVEDPTEPGRARTILFTQLQGLALNAEETQIICDRLVDIDFDHDDSKGIRILQYQVFGDSVLHVQLDRTIPMKLDESVHARLTRWHYGGGPSASRHGGGS